MTTLHVGDLVFFESRKGIAFIIQNNYIKFIAYKESNEASGDKCISLLSTSFKLEVRLLQISGLERMLQSGTTTSFCTCWQ